jgi:hypothetical protein
VPERTRGGHLPARNLSEVAAADLLAQPGCPVCRATQQATVAYFQAMFAEGVNDVGFRRQLDDSRGFCPRHTRALLDAERTGPGGTLASSILFEAILAVRAGEVRTAHAARGRTRRRRLADAARAPACPACQSDGAARARFIGTAVARADDPAWGEALASSPFCIDHLLALAAAAPPSETWRTIEARQLERADAIRARLAAYTHRFAHDRRHLITDDDRAAAGEAATLLGGGPERAGEPATDSRRRERASHPHVNEPS